MRKKYILSTLLSASLLFSCSDSEMIVPETDGGNNGNAALLNVPQDVVDGELFVKFKPEVEDILDNAGALSRSGCASRSSIPSVDEVLDIAGAYEFQRVFPVDKRKESQTRESGLHLWYLVKFDEDMDVQKVAQDMSKLAEVATVQYNREIKRAYNNILLEKTENENNASKTKAYTDASEQMYAAADPIVQYMSKEQLQKSINRTRKLMQEAAKKLDFIEAAQYRDELLRLEDQLKGK